ncbi:K+-transporting ATPase subunit F [Calothrix sp. NIES-4071]|nr:K+-transporting ATPase subunit F [Calothrix sp. NIES-4071]BAZ57464.1 K+-transporting ATPase subunit F [Calothrix sp. NIES-4105]
MSYFIRKKSPIIIFLLTLCFNVIIGTKVYAATGNLEPRHQAAIAGLGIIIIGLIIYLFDVVFRPDKY